MPDSKQLRILKKLTAHLEATPGYEGVKVFRGKTVVSAREVEDCMSLLEAPRPIVGSPAGESGLIRNESWTLLLQGWPKDDKENPSDPAYNMKAATEAHLSAIVVENKNGVARTDELYMLGRDISGMIVGQGIVRPPEEGASRLAMFYIPLVLELQTNVLNPYA